MATESCPQCVLLVEDDETLRDAIAAFLEQRGYVTVPAEDGQRALELLAKTDLARPCLVLADFSTLRVDWAGLIGALQPDDQLATLPMALVAVKPPGGVMVRIKKPINFDLLARIVKEHCCEGQGEEGKTNGGRDSIGSVPG